MKMLFFRMITNSERLFGCWWGKASKQTLNSASCDDPSVLDGKSALVEESFSFFGRSIEQVGQMGVGEVVTERR